MDKHVGQVSPSFVASSRHVHKDVWIHKAFKRKHVLPTLRQQYTIIHEYSDLKTTFTLKILLNTCHGPMLCEEVS